MIRPAVLVVLLLVVSAGAAPQDAVVRIPSHGASATVIHSEQGRTLLLGCAHAYEGASRTKRMVIDAPAPQDGSGGTGRVRLLHVDYRDDLSLVEIADGPLPYVLPVAAAGHRPGSRVISAGYDNMKLPMTVRAATITEDAGSKTHTREIPWHGRSGGALFDADAQRLIGVVHGYRTTMSGQPVHGIYVSHRSVIRFLDSYFAAQRSPQSPLRLPPFAGISERDCPDGRCPNPWQPHR